MNAGLISPIILGRLEPIRALSAERLSELASICRPESYPAGADPLRGADFPGKAIYVLKGEMKLAFPDGTTQVLVGGCEGANWPLGRKIPVPASAKAITEVELLSIDNDFLDIMMTWDQMSNGVARKVVPSTADSMAWSAMTGSFSVQTLMGSALSLLPAAHIHELMLRLERIPVAKGQVMIREGESGDYYYLIESGHAIVSRRVGGSEVAVADLKHGEAFGEEALVSEGKRNATVIMRTDGVLLRLAKPDFIELLREPLLKPITRVDAERKVHAGKARWLDVRYGVEFAEDGLDGALNIPLNEIRSAFGLLDPNTEYIVYCQSGRRSSAAAFLLAQHGISAYWLENGLHPQGAH